MVIVVLDRVKRCYTAQDGAVIDRALRDALAVEQQVTLSFQGVSDVPSSFVNAAIVPLVEEHGEEWVKARLTITHATKQVAHMLRRCVSNAKKKALAS
jgi:hypothetical protein